jgi:hypothetical protein
MSFSKYISQTPQDFGQALQVSGFIVSNGSSTAPYTENLQRGSNDLFTGGSGIPVGTLVSSGQFYSDPPYISWNLYNPAQKKVYNDYDIPDLNFFSGFDIVLRDETGLLVQTLETGYYENYYEIDIENLKTQFSLESGRDERRFRFEVVANDYYNRTHTGVFFLTCERPDVTGLDISIGKSIKFQPKFSKVSGIDSLVLCVGTGSSFDVFSTGAENSAVAYQDINVKGQTVSNFQQNYDADLESSYYYGFYAVDIYGTGSTYIYPSSIKPLEIDPLNYNIKPSGFRGKIIVERDPINRNINSYYKGVINKDFTLEKVNYEVFVFQSGREDLESSFSIESQSISNVSFLVHGSGQNRIDYNFFTGDNFRGQDYYYSGSNSEPVFSTYNTTGIQWKEHTILLDNQSSLPGGSYTGQSPVKEIAIAAGNTNSNKIYLGVQIDPDNKEFYFYPEGGYFNSGIYTGTYAENITGGYYTYENYGPSGPSGPSGPTGPTGPTSSGYAVLLAGVTGSLMATNLSGFISTNYEPNFTYDISADSDYYFKVRPIDKNGNKGTFTDFTYVSSGDIVSAISGAGYSTGLFNGDTNSGLAFYNADLDILNISDNLFSSGSGFGINVSTPEHHFHVSGDAQISGYLYDSQNTTGEAGYVLASEEGGPQWKQIEDVLSGVGGSGATNYVARWADEDTLTTGVLYDNNTNVGIGTASPNYKLEVDGTTDFGNTTTYDNAAAGLISWNSGTKFKIRGQSGHALSLGANGTEDYVWIDTDGNVGIGTASPNYKLHTVGGAGVFDVTGAATLNHHLAVTEVATLPDWRPYSGTTTAALQLQSSATRGILLAAKSTGNQDFYNTDGLDIYVASTIGSSSSNRGNLAMSILSGGNVGINTITPNSKLQIVGSTSGDSVLKVDGTNGTLFEVVDDLSDSLMSVNDAAGLPVLEVFADNHIVAGRYNQNDFYLNTNGNLGLGTSSPVTKLNIKGDQSANGQLYIEPTNDSEYAGLVIKTTRGADRAYAIFAGGTGTDDLNFRFRDASAGVDRMVIDSSGNVGIGIVAPQRPFTLYKASSPVIQLVNSTTGTAAADGMLLTQSGVDSYIENGEVGKMFFRTSATNRVTIDSDGNVGIGTVIPAAKLDVVGDACINSVRVGRGRCNVSNNTAVGLNALYYATGACNTGLGHQALINTTTGCKNTAVGFNSLLSNSTGYVNTAVGTQSMLCNTIGFANTALGNSTLFINISGSCNTAIGFQSLYYNESGCLNVAVGYNSLLSNTSGCSNTAVGTYSLCSNTTGGCNIAVGWKSLLNNTSACHNLAIGACALFHTTTGIRNIGIGHAALKCNITGSHNTGVGFGALVFNTGTGNTAHGACTLYNNTTGADNTAVGLQSLFQNTTGSYNTALGSCSLFTNTTGLYNTAVGACSLYNNTTANNNTAQGYQSLFSNISGSENTASGYRSLYNNTTGSYNTAHGMCSLYSNTTGNINTAHGNNALYSNTTGCYNTAVGVSSLYSNTTGCYNIAQGYRSLNQNTTANNNTARGYASLRFNTTGGDNTASGYRSLYSNTTGSYNTSVGSNSLFSNISGSENTAIGRCAGCNITTGSCNIFIGAFTEGGSVSDTNAIAIGYNVNTCGSNTINIGNTSNTKTIFECGYVGIGTANPSQALNIARSDASGSAEFDLYSTNSLRQPMLTFRKSASNTIGTKSVTPSGGELGEIEFIGVNTGSNFAVKSASIISLQDGAAGATYIPGALTFGTGTNSAAVSERMRIDSSGNVGIGTTIPTGGKLQVAGKVRIDAGSGNDALNLNAYDLLKWDNANHIHFGGYKSGQWAVLKFYSSATERLNIGSDVNVQGATDLNICGTSRRLSFTSGTGTIRTATSNNLILQTNSTSAITIYPTQQIQFNAYGSGTFTGTATQRLAVDSSGNVIEIPIGSGAVDGSGAANKVTYWTDTDTISYNNNFHWDNTNGNLGIGTSVPSSTLHVSDSTSGSSVLKVDGTSGTIFEVTDDLSSSLMSVNTIAGLPVFEVFADNHMVAGRYNQNDFYLDTNGNLGLGTNAPSKKLEVVNSTAAQILAKGWGPDSAGNDGGAIQLGEESAFHGLFSYDNATSILYIDNAYNSSSGDIRFRTKTSGTSITAVTIEGDGDVGIGTVSPSAKLQVAGNTYLNSGSNVWNLIGNNGINFARETYFGYSSSYRILQLGTVGATRAISIGVDVSSNASGSFGGDEIIFPNQREIITPNAADNGYLGLIATDNQNKVRIGNYRWNILVDTPGITIDTSASTNYVGIGTVNPVNNLTVAGDIGYTGYLGQGSIYGNVANASYARVQLYDPATGYTTFNNISYGYYFQTANSTKVTILNNGNVGIGTNNPAARLELIPSGNSLSGLTSKALIISNTNDTSWTADALTSYNATTGYDITDLSSLSFFARPTQGNILTFASETANQGTVHRFVNLNSSAVEPLYRWDFYQYDGSGTGSDNFKVPDKLFQIRVREGTSEVEKFTIKGNGNIGIGTDSPAQQLHLTGSIRLPNTTNTTTGIIYKDTSRFIHNYQHPTGDTAVPAGFNTFVGLVAGNLSMGSTATSVSHGSYNSGFGYQVLNALTTGYSNTAIGFQAGEDITTGYKNTIVGMNAGGQLVGGSRNTFIGDDSGLLTNSGINNTALGAGALRLNTTGSSNTIVGTYSLDAHTSPAGHTTLGYAALTNLTTGSYNIAIGYAAGSQRVATGDLTNSSYGIYLGYAVDGTEGASGEIVIGKDAQGLGSNTTRLGGSNITKTVIEYGSVGIGTTSPDTKLQIDSGSGIGTVDNAYSLAIRGDGIDGIQILSDSAYSGRIVFGDQNSTNAGRIYYDHSTDAFRFFTNGTEKVSILSGGNVGIGTVSPTYGLEIRNSTTSQTGALYVQAALNSSGKGLVINSNTRTTSDNAEHLLQIIDRSNSDSLVTTVEGVTLAKLSTRLNTLSPLQVNSQIALGGSLYTFSTVQGGADLTLTSNANPANLGVLSNIKFKLGSSGGGGPNERMRIQSDGSIGVWNTTDIENWAGSSYRAIEFPRAALMYHTGTSTDFYINSNTYYDGAWKYKSTAAASQFILGSSGDALIRTIASGTIDTGITWTTPFIVKNTGNVGIGTANPSEKLDVVGNVKHEGLTMTSGTDVDQLKTFTQTLTITTSWQDTGIDGSDLTTGTYIVQLLGDDDEVGGTYSVYYSGMMSWYSSGTNDTDFTSEIALHRAGHADVGRTLYLRTVTNASGGNDLELQIAGNYNATGSDSYVFKFRRMI